VSPSSGYGNRKRNVSWAGLFCARGAPSIADLIAVRPGEEAQLPFKSHVMRLTVRRQEHREVSNTWRV
jgi:hypothetical protein